MPSPAAKPCVKWVLPAPKSPHEQNHIAWLHTLRNRASKLLGFFNAMAYVRHASPFLNAIPNVENEASGNKKEGPVAGTFRTSFSFDCTRIRLTARSLSRP